MATAPGVVVASDANRAARTFFSPNRVCPLLDSKRDSWWELDSSNSFIDAVECVENVASSKLKLRLNIDLSATLMSLSLN